VWFDGDTIEGDIQIMLHRSLSVDKLTVRVQGRIAPPDIGRLDIFWSTCQTLWKASSAQESGIQVSSLFPRLPAGNHHWPFRLILPNYVTIGTSSETHKPFCLPPSFRQPGPTALVEYEIRVTVDRDWSFPSYFSLDPALNIRLDDYLRGCPISELCITHFHADPTKL